MKILDSIFKDDIFKAIVLSDSGKEYVVSLDTLSGRSWCTCPLYVYDKERPCKHIRYVIDNIDYDNMAKKKFGNFKTGCSTIDLLLGNGIPQGTITAIYAESGIGKTILGAQLVLAEISQLGKDVIVIETEGNREEDYLEILYRFKDRWGLTESEIRKHLHFYPVISDFMGESRAMIDLLKMVGYDAIIEQSKKGDKYSITFKECKPKLKEKDLSNSGLLIIDSLTEPLKATIGHKSQNLPARSELISRFFYKLISLGYNYGLAVLIIHHASVNPMQVYGRDFGKPYGGDEVLYNSKYILAIIDSDMTARAKYGKTARRVMLLKHPYNPDTGELYPINLKKDYGFTDEE